MLFVLLVLVHRRYNGGMPRLKDNEESIFPLFDSFHSFDWERIEASVDAGHVIEKALHPEFQWGRLFPAGISEQQARVLHRCGLAKPGFEQKGVLHAFCEQDDTKSVSNLLDAGFDPNMVGSFGMCPLVYALYGNSEGFCAVSTACLLLDRDASPNAEGLGSTGRASFVFIEVLPSAFACEGWEGVDRLWKAIARRADWNLPYDEKLYMNYFLFEVIDRHPANETTRQLFWDALQRLSSMGVSFDPGVKSPGYPTLGKYVARLGSNARWLMACNLSADCRLALDAQTKPLESAPPRTRL